MGIAVGLPIARRIRGVDFVDQHQLAFGVETEFVLGVDQDQAARCCDLGTARVKRKRGSFDLRNQLVCCKAFGDDLLRRHGAVVGILLGRRREHRRVEPLVLLQAVGQDEVAEIPSPLAVMRP